MALSEVHRFPAGHYWVDLDPYVVPHAGILGEQDLPRDEQEYNRAVARYRLQVPKNPSHCHRCKAHYPRTRASGGSTDYGSVAPVVGTV